MQSMTFYVPEDIHHKLKGKALETGEPMRAIVTRLISEYLLDAEAHKCRKHGVEKEAGDV